MTFLENLLFAQNPKTQIENNLDDEMSVCIIKESEKDRNYPVVTNEKRIGYNYFEFIESTRKESSCGSEDKGRKQSPL